MARCRNRDSNKPVVEICNECRNRDNCTIMLREDLKHEVLRNTGLSVIGLICGIKLVSISPFGQSGILASIITILICTCIPSGWAIAFDGLFHSDDSDEDTCGRNLAVELFISFLIAVIAGFIVTIYRLCKASVAYRKYKYIDKYIKNN